MHEDAFLVGRTVYLRRPDVERDVEQGDWHRWFNDLTTTRYLVHGSRPISRAEEAEYVRAALASPRQLVLAVVDVATDAVCGTVSLGEIDHVHRRAEISLVLGRIVRSAPSAALEAMALLSKHAFDRLNLKKLYAGQHEDLWPWINTLSLIGYELKVPRGDARTQRARARRRAHGAGGRHVPAPGARARRQRPVRRR